MKNSLEFIQIGRHERQRKWMIVTSLLATLSCMLCIAMLLLGNTIYSVKEVIRALSGEQIQGVSFAVNTIRLPRMLAGLFAGFAFGVGGYCFQTMLRNPLANPNVLGITTGSSAAAVFCIVVLHTNNTIVSITSVIAAMLTVILIYVFSRGKSFSIGRLILVGIGMQAMLNAIISYLLLIGAQQDIPAAIRWLSGSLNGSQMYQLPPLMITVLICASIIIMLGKHLSILELGELAAASLGVHTDKTRILIIVSSVWMIAMATAVTGPIAFIAFLSGPIGNKTRR